MERPPCQQGLCNAWLDQKGPMSYQKVESHGIYEKIDWSSVPDGNTYFNCTVAPKKVLERSETKKGSIRAHGVFENTVYRMMQKKLRDSV